MKKELWLTIAAIFALFVVTIVFSGNVLASYTKEDKAITRIGPDETRKQVEAGKALLICSYNDGGCKSKLLDGALLRSELDAKLKTLPKDQELIFYCGWPNEGTSASVAVKYQNQGFTNIKVLKGGIDGWKAKKYPMKKAQ